LNYIQKYPLRTKQILGISYEQFQSLLKAATEEHLTLRVRSRYNGGNPRNALLKIKNENEKQKVRINSPGGGRKELLSTSEQICLCLFYLRQIPTQDLRKETGFLRKIIDLVNRYLPKNPVSGFGCVSPATFETL
jgi:hypothetical protein